MYGTFWHAGNIVSPLIGDFNKDGEEEIVATAVNNGLERTVAFSINLNNLEGQGPSTRQYTFKNIKDAKLNKYILLPKSELTKIYSKRYNEPFSPDSKYNSSVKEFQMKHLHNIATEKEKAVKEGASVLKHLKDEIIKRYL